MRNTQSIEASDGNTEGIHAPFGGIAGLLRRSHRRGIGRRRKIPCGLVPRIIQRGGLMSCVQTLKTACMYEVRTLAAIIDGEMRGIVGGHTRSGAALGAIHIEMSGTGAFVGGTGGEGTKHLYWLNEGNGPGRITPVSARALWVKDYGIWRKSVSSYEGIHFVEAIAARHGGG